MVRTLGVDCDDEHLVVADYESEILGNADGDEGNVTVVGQTSWSLNDSIFLWWLHEVRAADEVMDILPFFGNGDLSLSRVMTPAQIVSISEDSLLLPCPSAGACLVSQDGADLQCSTGHGGIVCSECKPGWVSVGWLSSCIDCDENTLQHVLAFLGVVIGLIVGIGIYVYVKSRRTDAVKQFKKLEETGETSFRLHCCSSLPPVKLPQRPRSPLRRMVPSFQSRLHIQSRCGAPHCAELATDQCFTEQHGDKLLRHGWVRNQHIPSAPGDAMAGKCKC